MLWGSDKKFSKSMEEFQKNFSKAFETAEYLVVLHFDYEQLVKKYADFYLTEFANAVMKLKDAEIKNPELHRQLETLTGIRFTRASDLAQ